jgi:membrane-bound metal-dependent hydrolase YbcI (DUF457 family)
LDTVTHGLAGWLIARSLPDQWKGDHPRTANAVVALAAMLPDVDNVASLLGSETYVRIHRGLSHSFPGIFATSLLVALLVVRLGKANDRRAVFLLAVLGQVSHQALDLLNSYGTQILQPFSNARLSLDLLFVVDLVFTGIILAGIALSRRGPVPARAALAVLAAYVGAAALLHEGARGAVRDAALREGMTVVSAQALPALPFVELPPLESLVSPSAAVASLFPASPENPGTEGSALARRVEIPFPAGPLAWNGFVDDGRTWRRAQIAPFTRQVVWKERALHGADVPEVRALRGRLQDVDTYLWFARLPAVEVSSTGGRTEMTFFDLRFGGVGDRMPFILRVTEAPGEQPSARWGG